MFLINKIFQTSLIFAGWCGQIRPLCAKDAPLKKGLDLLTNTKLKNVCQVQTTLAYFDMVSMSKKIIISNVDTRTLVTSGSDGRVVTWNVADGSASVIEGEGHNCQVT